MRDLRKDLAKLFDTVSYPIIYVRRDLRFRCECYSERSGESRADCPRCFGTSYHVTIEKHRTRRHPNAVPLSLSGVNQLAPAGMLLPKAYIYYFEYQVNAQDSDLILEVEWDDQENPVSIKEKQMISLSEPKTGFEGRVEFYHVYTRMDMKGVNDDTALG
jgi:hypothetical protein